MSPQAAPPVSGLPYGGPVSALLPGNRLHLQHGPIDLVVEAWGEGGAVVEAYRRAGLRFQTILTELVSELPLLRRGPSWGQPPTGSTALRMWRAATAFSDHFITPMAAVAGSVADEIVSAMSGVEGLTRIFVNNGGDITLWFGAGGKFRIGVVPRPLLERYTATPPVIALIRHDDGIGGVATSGWHGRSHSLGIADAVTVFADNAACADAAATLIANAVDLESDVVQRKSAVDLDLDSDLGERLVTVEVGALSELECLSALGNGKSLAQDYLSRGLIKAAFLYVQGSFTTVGEQRLLNHA